MSDELQFKSALSPYRVLDLSEGAALMCGKVLADLGADVIKIEKPAGSPSRNIGPFYKDIPDSEKSLFWFAYNTNKRGITLNIDSADGQEIFKLLAKKADLVIESFPPGYLDDLGLGYKALESIDPRIILTSITPYGQSGPKAHYKASDLTVWASGVMLFINGDRDRPPHWLAPHQAFAHAAAEAASASMMALWHRKRTGEGQHVDVSAQECVLWTTLNIQIAWDMHKYNPMRSGSTWTIPSTGTRIRWTFPCKDGYVAFTARGGGAAGWVHSTKAMVKWMDEEGMCPDWMKKYNWATDYDAAKLTQEESNRLDEPFLSFFKTKTKAELFERAIKEGILLAPVNTTREFCEDPQLAARKFWTELQHPELGEKLTYCGPFIRLSETPPALRRRAPLLGEHNQDIYEKEMGFSRERLILLRQAGAI